MEEPSNKAEIDALVKAYKKELKIAGSTKIQSLKEKIKELEPYDLQYRYFLSRYIETAPSTSKPEAPEVPAAAAAPDRYLNAVSTYWPSHVPKKVPKVGKSRRRRNKKGKKKTNKRRRN